MLGQETNGTSQKQLLAALKCCGFKATNFKPMRGRDYRLFKFDAVLHGRLKGDSEYHLVVWDSKRNKKLDPYEPCKKFYCTSFAQILP